MTPSQVRDQEAVRMGHYFDRVEAQIGELIEGYKMLKHVLEPEKRGVRIGSRGSGGPATPADDGVIDLARNVDMMVDVLMPEAWGTLRMGLMLRPMQWVPAGTARREATIAGLAWLRVAFRAIYAENDDTGENIAGSVSNALSDVAPRTTKTGVPPYRSARRCKDCDQATVIVDPQRGARCTNCRGPGV